MKFEEADKVIELSNEELAEIMGAGERAEYLRSQCKQSHPEIVCQSRKFCYWDGIIDKNGVSIGRCFLKREYEKL